MKLAPIIDPSVRKPSPKPVRVDLRKVFMVGTSLWAVGLVICMILLALGFDVERGQTMCAAGTVSASSAGQFRTFRAARANGSVKVNVLPCPGLLHTDAEP